MRTVPLRLLDSNIIIDVEHRHPTALAWYASAPIGSLALPGYVVMELYQSAPNNTALQATDLIIAHLPIVWPSEVESRQAIAHFRHLHLSHGVGLIDVLIAATALSYGVPLCTFNIKHFRHIPGLALEQPYVR